MTKLKRLSLTLEAVKFISTFGANGPIQFISMNMTRRARRGVISGRERQLEMQVQVEMLQGRLHPPQPTLVSLIPH